jgi:hypothetical protein
MDVSVAKDAVTSMLHAIDDVDRDAVRSSSMDRVHLDYSSLTGVAGGEAWKISATTLKSFYQEGNPGLPDRTRTRAASSRRVHVTP